MSDSPEVREREKMARIPSLGTVAPCRTLVWTGVKPLALQSSLQPYDSVAALETPMLPVNRASPGDSERQVLSVVMETLTYQATPRASRVVRTVLCLELQ